MSRETQVADHWSSAHVVQELGWRTRLPSISLPGSETWQWRREQFEVRPFHEKAVLVFCEVVHHTVLTALAAALGARMLPYGTLPGQDSLPLMAALAGALVACVQCLVWPPDPTGDGRLNHHRKSATVEEPDDEDDEDAYGRDSYAHRPHPGQVPLSAGKKGLIVLFVPVLVALGVVAFVAVCVALAVWLLTRRVWPAVAVLVALAVVAPRPTFDDIGFAVFSMAVLGGLLSTCVLWPLRALCGMPAPDIGRKRRGEVASDR